MMGKFQIRTDLALEARESYGEEDIRIRGVRIEEEADEEREIYTTIVTIETENGAKAMGKPVGTYITIEAPNMSTPDEGYHREISEELAKHLREIVTRCAGRGRTGGAAEASVAQAAYAERSGAAGRKTTSYAERKEESGRVRKTVHAGQNSTAGKKTTAYAERSEESGRGAQAGEARRPGENGGKCEAQAAAPASVLVVGLGNRDVTPDALGPDVVNNLHITRHMIREYGRAASKLEREKEVSAIVPGVMAQTGMETLEIIRGVVEETKPEVVVAIDALAARSTKRLNRTIQITDTGINPGSGVGNHRNAINAETLGVPVIAVGVPTVVDAATIVNDTMEELIAQMDSSASMQRLGGTLGTLNQAEKHQMIRELISPHLNTMFVTPKDIDETVKYLSFTISEGLNIAFSEVGDCRESGF